MSFKKTGSHYDKNLKEWLEHFEAEYESDVSALPPANPGSTCFIKETGKTVKLAYNGVWGGPEQPFGYETTTVKEVLAECQPEFNADWNDFGFDKALEISVGEKYIVSWNGVDFECVCETVESDGSAIMVLGNAGALMDGEDTGEPFAVISYPGDLGTDFPAVAAPLDGSTELTISIRQEVTTVTKLSGKYVEGMGWAEKSVSGKVVVEETAYRVNSDFGTLVNPEPLENGYASMPTEFSFESGKTYRITVDGVPYIGTAEYREGYGNFGGGDGVPLVDENGGYHGVFVTAMGAGYSNYFYYDEGPEEGHTGTFIIEEVAEVETIHPIDEKFLPAGGSGPFVVKAAALDGGFCTCDKSLTEINAAIASGVPVMGVFGDIPVFYAGGNTFVQFSDGIITTWSYEDEYRWYPNA